MRCQWIGCNKYLTQEEFGDHINNHLMNPFNCQICGQFFSDESVFNQHKDNEHSLGPKTSFQTIAPKPVVIQILKPLNDYEISVDYKLSQIKTSSGYKCNYFGCNEEFKGLLEFQIHRIIHSNANFLKIEDMFVSVRKGQTFEFKCRIPGCHVSVLFQPKITSHLQLHFGTDMFRCENRHCFQAFPDRVKCREHEISHYYDNSLTCLWPDCHLQQTNRVSIIMHVNTHLENIIECDVCHQKFKRSSHLDAHRIVHNLDDLKDQQTIDLSYYFKKLKNSSGYECLWPNCTFKLLSTNANALTLHVKQHYGLNTTETKNATNSKTEPKEQSMSSPIIPNSKTYSKYIPESAIKKQTIYDPKCGTNNLNHNILKTLLISKSSTNSRASTSSVRSNSKSIESIDTSGEEVEESVSKSVKQNKSLKDSQKVVKQPNHSPKRSTTSTSSVQSKNSINSSSDELPNKSSTEKSNVESDEQNRLLRKRVNRERKSVVKYDAKRDNKNTSEVEVKLNESIKSFKLKTCEVSLTKIGKTIANEKSPIIAISEPSGVKNDDQLENRYGLKDFELSFIRNDELKKRYRLKHPIYT